MSPEFSLPEFLSWCRTKPADERYNSADIHQCAVAQFGRATGQIRLDGIGDLEPVVGRAITPILLSHTFGELISRLERIVEPRAIKRTWLRLRGKTIGEPVAFPTAERLEKLCPETPDYARIEAYLADIDAVSA